VPVPGTELWPAHIPVVLGYPAYHFFVSLFWKSCNIHIHILYIHTYIHICVCVYVLKKLVPLHPCVPGSPTQ
jgi:hypothetical protein